MTKPRTKATIAEKAEGTYLTKSRAAHQSAGAVSNKKKDSAQKQADKILKALDEANEIHAGRKQGKSFDSFIEEL